MRMRQMRHAKSVSLSHLSHDGRIVPKGAMQERFVGVQGEALRFAANHAIETALFVQESGRI